MNEDRLKTPASSDNSRRLTAETREMLLRLARQTLMTYLEHRRIPECRADAEELLEPRATFVTLRRTGTGELRGCRGEIVARQPLVESVVHMTIAAAVDDPRFPPVGIEEVDGLCVEISALTPLQPVRSAEIEVGRHGLMITIGRSSGLLLPQVPVELGWDRDQFLTGVCRKAGLGDEAWKQGGAELYSFEAEVWGEEV